MSKKGTKALASATLMSLVLTTALSAGPVQAAAGQAERVGAADRYATAAQVATKNWTTSDNVVLVSGDGYADAVSASALAKKLNAPILLTSAKTLSTDTASALATLKAKNVYVVGGEASVSTAISDELAKTYTVERLGGANRYETNVKVAEKLVELGVKADEVIMVGGEGFSDALSVAPIAAAKGQILLLGMNDANYMKPVLDFVAKNGSKVTVVGTKNVISDSILSTVNGTRVDGGKDRWDTNQKVLAAFKDTVKFDKLYVASAAYNAQDNGYADALVASALAGKYAAPLVLVDKDGNEGTTNALAYIKANATKATDLQVVGGTGVVSDALLAKVTEAVSGTVTPIGDTTVKSIEATSLNQIKIVFGTDVDSDSAEDVGNYKIDGTTLDNTVATATLQDDNRTLLLTLKEQKEQQKDYTVSVKNGVLVADKSKNVSEFEQKVTFSDVTAPIMSSVSVKGNSKITVNFSEPVKMPAGARIGTDNKYKLTNDVASQFKINGQNITSFGLSLDDSQIKHAIATTGGAVWADQIDFYFTTKLPTGSNTLKVSDGKSGDSGILVDSAGFIVKEATQDFNVDTLSTAPVIKEVTADADNTVWVRFDRPMDSKTALVGTNYELNGEALDASLALKEGDCTVKLTHVKNINFGSNTIYIKNSVKDAYGNKVADDTRVSFTMAKDETKPTVTNVNMIDSETIRVTFSKDIDVAYATNVKNYTLKDSNGVDISDHIRIVKPAYKTVSDSTTSGAVDAAMMRDFGNDNVWDIKMYKNEGVATNTTGSALSNDWRLTGAKYTLTVKNMIDTTANKNSMDEYTTTLNGSDDIAPKMLSAYKKSSGTNADQKVVVLFSEAMDTSTLNNLDNYKYKNGAGDSKTMPSDTKITIGNDNKSVTLEFPSSYAVKGASGYDAKSDDNKVAGIVASNLKDEAGNLIDSFNNFADVSGITGTFGYKSNTYRIENDGDDLLVKLQFVNAIDPDTAVPDNFKVEGQKPDGVSIVGSDVVLRFNKDSESTTKIADAYFAAGSISTTDSAIKANDKADKAEIIKLAGSQAQVEVLPGVKDMSGASPAAGFTIGTGSDTIVYNYLAAPKTTSDYWYATNDGSKVLSLDADATTSAAVVITFDTILDSTYTAAKPDDFRFTIDGSKVDADKVVVKGNSLVFLFKGTDKKAKFATEGTTVNVVLNNTSADIEALADKDGSNAKYVPSSDDKTKTRQVKVIDSAKLQ